VIPPWFVWHCKLLAQSLAAGEWDLLLLARWTIQGVSLTLAIAIADLLLGAAILGALRVQLPARLRGAAAIATGSGASAVLILGLGVLRRIYFPWVLGLTLLSAAAGIWLMASKRGRWFVFGPFAALRSRWWWALAPVLVFHLWSMMMPVMEFDATMYHQASARWYEETHRLAYHEGIRFNAQPHLPILLFLRQRILLGEDTLVKLVNLQFAVALYLVLAHYAHRRRVSSTWPVAFLALSPAFVWVAELDYADFAMTAWFAVAVALLLERRPAIGIAALLLGCAAASKLQGAVMAGLLGLTYLGYRRDWRPVAALAAGTALVSLPWWIRSYRHTGSPVAPFFIAGNPESGFLFELSSKYGDGRDILAFLKLPWNAIVQSPLVFADIFVLGPVLAIALGIGVAAIFFRRKPSPETLFLLALFFAFLLFWFRTGQVMRYLTAMLPVLAMLFAATIAALPVRRWAALPFLACGLAASVLPSTVIRYRTLPPVRIEEKEKVLAEWMPYYRAARALGRVANPAERTYLWFAEESRYYVPTYSIGDWFGPLRYGVIASYGEDPQAMIDRMRGANFQYLLIDRRVAIHHGAYGEPWLSSGLLRRGGPLPDGIRQLYSDERYVLYRFD
jgi:hypothetical protein